MPKEFEIAREQNCTAFAGHTMLSSGSRLAVALAIKAAQDNDTTNVASVLVFDDDSNAVELDLRGTAADIEQRYTTANPDLSEASPAESSDKEQRGPGRPKLGVVAREITLLPRHWDWLASQPGGASVAVRKLVETASKANATRDNQRVCRENTYRFMSAMAGNLINFEEATRALFNGDATKFAELKAAWPADISQHLSKISKSAFE